MSKVHPEHSRPASRINCLTDGRYLHTGLPRLLRIVIQTQLLGFIGILMTTPHLSQYELLYATVLDLSVTSV